MIHSQQQCPAHLLRHIPSPPTFLWPQVSQSRAWRIARSEAEAFGQVAHSSSASSSRRSFSKRSSSSFSNSWFMWYQLLYILENNIHTYLPYLTMHYIALHCIALHYIHTYIHIYMYIYIYAHVYVYKYIHVCVYTYIYIYRSWIYQVRFHSASIHRPHRFQCSQVNHSAKTKPNVALCQLRGSRWASSRRRSSSSMSCSSLQRLPDARKNVAAIATETVRKTWKLRRPHGLLLKLLFKRLGQWHGHRDQRSQRFGGSIEVDNGSLA